MEVASPEIGAAAPSARHEQAGQREGAAAVDNLEEQKGEQLEPVLLVTDAEFHFQEAEGASSSEVRGSEAAAVDRSTSQPWDGGLPVRKSKSKKLTSLHRASTESSFD